MRSERSSKRTANAEDILAEAQQINEERAAKAEAAAFADEAAEVRRTLQRQQTLSNIRSHLPGRDNRKKSMRLFWKQSRKRMHDHGYCILFHWPEMA